MLIAKHHNTERIAAPQPEPVEAMGPETAAVQSYAGK